MGIVYNNSIITDGLVLCLDAANRRSYPGAGTTWFDISGNGRNATAAGTVGPTWNSNGYFNFTGGVIATNYSRFDAPSPAMTDLTAEVFYRPTNAAGTVFRMDNDDYHIALGRVAAGEAYNDFVLYPSTDNGLNNWVYNAITWSNGLNLFFYKNGIVTTSGTRSTQDTNGVATGTLRIGTRNDAYFEHFIGDIALVKIYNRALTRNEIWQNFNATRGRFGL